MKAINKKDLKSKDFRDKEFHVALRWRCHMKNEGMLEDFRIILFL